MIIKFVPKHFCTFDITFPSCAFYADFAFLI